MLKKLAVLCFLGLAAPMLPACSSTGGTVAVNEDARKGLLVAEYSFQAALKFVQTETAAGRIKGKKAADVSKALAGAKIALDQARAVVRSGSASAGTLVAAAASSVAAVLTLLGEK